MKKVRNAVRCFLMREDKVVCIKYKVGETGYIDIPGGKIEEGETPEDASIREVYEETGMKVENLVSIGDVTTEYPDRIFNFKVFLVTEFFGIPEEQNENEAFFISIGDLSKEEKRFAITYLLTSEKLKKDLDNRDVKVKFHNDCNHKILKIENNIKKNSKNII